MVKGQWVFGGIERRTRMLVVEPMESSVGENLLSILKEWVLRGTTVYYDCWMPTNVSVRKGVNILW